MGFLKNLFLRGRQILEWSTPYNWTSSETRLTTSDCSGDGLFCSTLTLSKAVANETGEYRCFYKSLPKEDGKTSVAVYVFIQGIIFLSDKFLHSFQNAPTFSPKDSWKESWNVAKMCPSHTSFVILQDNPLTSSFFITYSPLHFTSHFSHSSCKLLPCPDRQNVGNGLFWVLNVVV